MTPGHWLDLILLATGGVVAWQGWRRGLALQALSYGGLLFGMVAGSILAPGLAGLFRGSPGITRAVVSMIAVFGLGIVFQLAGFLIGASIRSRLRKGPVMRRLDAMGGTALSLVAVAAGVWFAAVTLADGPSATVARAIKGSVAVRTLDRMAPNPPALVAGVKRFLETSGFPEVFSGISPRLAPAVPPPDPATLDTPGVAAAALSTVKVSGIACGVIQEGSGWVAGPEIVVTNAHVVAGMIEPRVQLPDGETNLAAVPVAYDPDRDLAVLLVEGLDADPLEMLEAAPERGTTGAVLGYPERGPFTSTPAAVRTTINARGRDIYYDHPVDRLVEVLQAQVRPGNSGGPVVGTDGRVIGVVFAADAGQPDIAYALAPEEVRPVLAAAGAEVPTGACAA